MARTTKLDDLVSQRIVNAIADGNRIEVAAQLAHVDPRTVYAWMARGKRLDGEPYDQFYQKVKAARAEAEGLMVQIVRQAAAKTWQAAAWYLERRYPKHWALRLSRLETQASAMHTVPAVDSAEAAGKHEALARALRASDADEEDSDDQASGG